MSSPPRKNSVYNFISMPSTESVTKTASAVYDKATQILPYSLTSRVKRSSSSVVQPAPVVMNIRLQNGDECYLPLESSTSVFQMLDLCSQHVHVPTRWLRLVVEEERPSSAPSLVSAIRSTASSLTSREKVRETLVDWINFIFLPEAVNREVRGRGVLSWLRESVMPHLQPPPPNVAQVTVLLLGGDRRGWVELSSSATLTRLKDAVERSTNLSPDRQRLVVIELTAHGPIQKLFWAVARVAYALFLACMNVALMGVRWVALGSEANQTLKLQLQPKNGVVWDKNQGASSCINTNRDDPKGYTHSNSHYKNYNTSTNNSLIEVRKDMTLGQLMHALQLQHGDSIGLEGLVLSDSSGRL